MDVRERLHRGMHRPGNGIPAAAVESQRAESTTPRGLMAMGSSIPWPALARWTWVALLIIVAIRVVVTIRIFFREVHTPCAGDSCQGPPSMTIRQMHLLHQASLSPEAYAACCAALLVFFIAVFCGVAGVIIWRRSNDSMAVLTAFTLALFGGLSFGLPDQLFRQWEPALWPAMTIFALLGSVAIMTFFYVFPDGRPVPRWTLVPLAVWSITQIPMYLAPDFAAALGRSVGPLAGPITGVISLGTFGSLIYGQIYRYRRVSTPVQREQTKWVIYGIAAAIVGWIGLLVFWNVSDINASTHNPMLDFTSVAVGYLLWLLIPLSIGVAILRYRLWDIDLLINRTLVYGSLTAMVVGVYVLTVGYLGTFFRTGNSLVISLLATGLVAVLFQPAREWLQRGINHLMYGERDEPYAVLSRLGQRLEATVAPDAVLPAIVQTITEALRLPYAAIVLEPEAGSQIAAEAGRPVSDTYQFPLTYQQEEVGRLLVSARTDDEGFSPSDHRLLDDLARQAGIAVHARQLHTRALRLATDLQRARETLVTTQEEERRRLRRDLHDGIGPTLASLAHRLDLVGDLVRTEPDAAITLLGELKGQVKGTVGDIRRLVYALRPPALDDFGLVLAIREHVERQTESSDLRISVDAPDPLPPLPAAIEVAVYRIALEGVTNVVRHAGARTCRIQLEIGEELCLTIEDDGCGLSPTYTPGVGLASMRERATELGGSCVIGPRPTGGTAIRVRLPLAWE